MSNMWTEIRNSFYKLKADLALKASAKRAPVINPYVEKLDYLWEKRGKKMTVEEVERRISGIHCGMKNTSCGDQLAKALREAYDAQKNA